MAVRDKKDWRTLGPKLRATNYVLGHDKPEYLSETALKFKLPNTDKNSASSAMEHKINTQELQKSHMVLGKQEVPWVSSTQLTYNQKNS